jgi:hypothetical protein
VLSLFFSKDALRARNTSPARPTLDKADIDPRALTVVGDELYLNYDLEVRDGWTKDVSGHVTKAGANFPPCAYQPCRIDISP